MRPLFQEALLKLPGIAGIRVSAWYWASALPFSTVRIRAQLRFAHV